MKTRPRGSSLQTVMAVMALMTVLAAGMVAVYTSSLNHVQAFSNGEIAQAEADSAIQELLARLNDDPTFGKDEEEIRGTRTANLSESEAYHVLTFDSGSSFPHSTNALTGSASGSLGRSVPAGFVHAVSTGYCRGKFRTVEVLIEHPPFPYGLASSGKIHSKTPLVVKGRSNSGNDDRPGHLVSNSSGGISVGTVDDAETYITGFVKSKGPIDIDQPATVLEGIFPNAGSIELPDIPLDSDEFDNAGETGVIEILDREFPAQVLDVMYHSNHSVTYNGQVEMKNAFLFCREDVTVYGGLIGTGAIVALGDVNIYGATSLSGTNNVAILSGGRITLSGNGNDFRGIVYAEGGITAKKITIVGNAITNNPSNPESCTVQLDEVVLISDESTSVVEFTARSNKKANRQRSAGRVPFPIDTQDGQMMFPRGNNEDGVTAIGAGDTDKSYDELAGDVSGNLEALWPEGGRPSLISWNSGYGGQYEESGAGEVARRFREAFDILEEAQEIGLEINALEQDNEDGDNDGAIAQREARLLALRADYNVAIEEAEKAYMDYVEQSASSDGSYLDDGFLESDHEVPYKFDLNKYLPPAERYRVGFYNVHGRRM